MAKRTIVAGVAALSAALVAVTPARAREEFPSHPIELIVPTAPGGGTDIASRLLASIAEGTLGQKILVVDKPGAGGAIGVETMLQAKPDGYTIAGVWNSPITITPQMFKVSYTVHSIVPIVLSDVSPIVFCVPKGFPANDGKQFIQELRDHPNKYTYGTDGVSGTVHLAGAMIFTSLGVQARAIPYGGAGETLEAFLGKSVDIYGGSIPPILPFVEKGSAKCPLVTSEKRNPTLPDAASVADLGIPHDQTVLWHAIIAPASIPMGRLKVLEQAFQQAARSAKYQEFAKKEGEEAVGWGSVQARDMMEKEYAAFGGVIQSLGLAKNTK